MSVTSLPHPATKAALRRELAALRAAHEELVSAARTAVAELFDGSAQPMSVLIDTLDRMGELPEFAPVPTDLGLAALGQDTDHDHGLSRAVAVGRRLA